MPESANTRLITEANLVEELNDWFSKTDIDVTRGPYFAKFDGATNDTAAIQDALNAASAAKVRVKFPAGTTIVDGELAIGSYTHVVGAGEGVTIIKIKNGAGWDPRGFYFKAGTTRSSLRHLTVDGNQPNRVLTGGSGGIYGTNVSVVNSTYIHIEHVASINAVQHCFDVTTPAYGDAGDGAIIPDPSEYVWITDCFADQHGDDGFTTHGSGKIWFTRCVAKGTWWKTLTDYTNSNGFEIDDYSYDVTITDCHAEDNAHGFEVKAHGNMSAARNVRLIGCTAEGNQVNFSLRHIGHTWAEDPLSLTAKNVQLIGCTSKNPRRVFFYGAEGFNQYSALTITSYRGVTISNFHAIGDPNYNYNGAAAIIFESRCEDIILDGYHIEGHTTAEWDVYSLGGAQPAKNVTIVNGTHRDSAPNGISTGSLSDGLISNITFNRDIPGSANGYGIRAYGNKVVRSNRFVTPYGPNFSISDTAYSVYETPMATNVLA
jgi:hypothetical protein